MKKDQHQLATPLRDIPVLDTYNFLRRFGRPGQFPSSMDLNKFAFERLENFGAKILRPMPWEFVRSKGHDFLFVTHGSLRRNRGIDEYDLAANCLIFIPAFQITRAVNMSDDIRGFYCNFDEAFLAEQSGRAHPLVEFPFWQPDAAAVWKIPEEVSHRISLIFDQIERAFQGNHPERERLVATYLLAIFYEIKPFAAADFTGNRPVSAADTLARQFKQWLDRDFDPHKTVGDYAALLNVSPNHLNKSVKVVFARTTSNLLEEYLLLEAKVLMRQTALSLGEIADRLGFSDLTHFGRFFKKKTGSSPRHFRVMD